MVESSKEEMERTLINKNNNKNNKVKSSKEGTEKTFIINNNHNKNKKVESSKAKSCRCCFCKREFKSLQALGGHMNGHRRERAMRDTARKDMRDGARRERPSKDLRDRARLKPNQSIFPDLNLHPSSSNTSFTNDRHPPPTHPPTIAYCSPSKIITACWSLAPPFTISDIGIKSLSSLSQSSSSKGQENLKTTTTNLPTTELSLEVGDRRQLLGFPNEKHNQHHQYGGNHNMMIRDETVRLDFEIGPCSEDDLDLELRLGFS